MPNADRIAELYKGEIWSAPVQQRARDRIHWLVSHAQGRTLDLGCSQGIAAILAARHGAQVVGVDLEFDRLEYAVGDLRREPDEVARRVQFLNACGTAMPFAGATFDRVLLGEVLEHLVEPERLLAEVRRVLRPGGLAAITLPFGYSPHHDHVHTFYPASAADLIAPFLSLQSMAVVDTYLRILAHPGGTTPASDRAALVYDQQPVLERHVRDAQVALHDARQRIRRLEETLRIAGAERERLSERHAQVGDREARRHHLERLRREIEDLRHDRAVARWQVAALKARRWWRLGVALDRARREPRHLPRLPREVHRIVRGPSTRPAPPRRVGPHTLGSSVSIPAVSPPDGPVARPDLKVATILDTFSALCFRYEFTAVNFGQSDWRQVLQRERPDLLLVESAWAGNDGRWSHTMTAKGSPRSPLVDLVRWCRGQGIPTVFWNKEDPPSYELFLGTAKLFDHVFTVDAGCLPRYREALGHDRVDVLPFAAQPRIHNPIRVGEGRVYDVAFAGMYFAERHPERRTQMEMILDPARDFGLHLFSRQDGADPRYRFPDKYAPHIVGTVPYETMLAAYKRYRVFLNVNTVVDSPTMCARRLFELSACGTTVLSGPSAAITNFFAPDLIAVSDSPGRTRTLLAHLLRNDELRDRRGLRAQRTVLRDHTFGHRVDRVLAAVGLGAPRPAPLVTAIVPTNRAGQVEHAIAGVARQSHRPLELVMILHGLDLDPATVERTARAAGIPRVTVLTAPATRSLGQCLNMGIDHAHGDYLAKMDDDNVYARDYLADLLDAFAYTDAQVVGKLAHYTHLASRNVTVLRFGEEEHRYVDLVQGGTMVMAAPLARRMRFQDLATGEDTDFLRRCRGQGVRIYAADRFNFVNVRQADPRLHTWQVSDEDLLTGATVEFYGPAAEHATV